MCFGLAREIEGAGDNTDFFIYFHDGPVQQTFHQVCHDCVIAFYQRAGWQRDERTVIYLIDFPFSLTAGWKLNRVDSRMEVESCFFKGCNLHVEIFHMNDSDFIYIC